MNNDQDPYKALERYQRSLEFFSKIRNSNKAAKTLLDMGLVYKDLDEPQKAIENYDIAYQLFKDDNDVSSEAKTLKLIADIYKMEKSYSEARRYYQRALKKFHTIEDHEMEKTVLTLISSCYQAEGALEDAINIEKEINKLNANQESKKNQFIVGKLEKKINDVWPTRNQSFFLIFYVLVMIFAELITNYYSLSGGLILQVILITTLIIGSISTSSHQFSYLLQAMILLPLTRIMSLIIPLIGIQKIYWFLIMLVPLMVAVLILMQSQNLKWKNVGFIKGNLPLQLGVGLTGLILGYVEYQIIHPTALIPDLNLMNIIFAGLIIIISTGFLEELIFRGIIQRNSENLMGKLWGVIFASVLFTVLNLGWNSLADITFIFLVSLFYGYIFQKTRSILGVGLSHGLCNVVLFLILPFI